MQNTLPYEAFTFLAAMLFFLIVRSKDLTVVIKKSSQRTDLENKRMKRGLLRSMVLEIIVFVPASAYLIILVAPILFPKLNAVEETHRAAWYSLMGIISYGFPFATIRRVITQMALSTLKDFREIALEDNQSSTQHGLDNKGEQR